MLLLLILAPSNTTKISDNTGANYSGTQNTQLRELEPNTNFFDVTTQPFYFVASSYGPGDRGHAVLRFTGLSSIAKGKIVSNARLRLKVRQITTGPLAVEAYLLKRNWVDAQATWNSYITATAWGTAGALNTTDIDTTLSGSGVFTTVDTYYEITGTKLDTEVQAIIDGIATNNGWMLRLTADTAYNNTEVCFFQKLAIDGSRPELVFDYIFADPLYPQFLLTMI